MPSVAHQVYVDREIVFELFGLLAVYGGSYQSRWAACTVRCIHTYPLAPRCRWHLRQVPAYAVGLCQPVARLLGLSPVLGSCVMINGSIFGTFLRTGRGGILVSFHLLHLLHHRTDQWYTTYVRPARYSKPLYRNVRLCPLVLSRQVCVILAPACVYIVGYALAVLSISHTVRQAVTNLQHI